ncbi:aromatase/cyclase [Jatrophihabitans sp. DSM 44399]|uniref:Aromatase/cyclase n=2 Tax=Jatrophihabitans lederbergiae TaxID=3075547 RepID=A0ABU2JHL4_9ACTN|nr:aromatase/cyclase [Jatrophihabitans sp. DSM 44399]MDT0264223.1 aromatase/cyclase [Jatrophihabitans sp. DSM 44399]
MLVTAPARAVYDLLADVTGWPEIFHPTVYAQQLQMTGGRERIRLWAMANGQVKTWVSGRTLTPEALRIDFRQEVSQHPVESMGGSWVIEDLGEQGCRIVLLHDFTAVGNDPENVAWIGGVIERNSSSELLGLKTAAEAMTEAEQLTIRFEDSIVIDGSAADVYDFLNEAKLWSERLPHVATVDLREDSPGLQVLRMETRTKDGSTHTTESVRVCLPHEKIVYKQLELPALMSLHTGHWLLQQDGEQVRATSRHTVTVKESKITTILGPEAGIEEARNYLRTALSGNSLATLGHAGPDPE